MTPVRRWLVAALVTTALVAVPVLPRVTAGLLPSAAGELDAATLLALVQDAPDEPYQALVETSGTLQLPVTGSFDDLGSLLGEPNRLRVWWADRDSWRVDRLLVAGESDLHHTAGTTVAYSYEGQRAEVSRDPDIRLPRTSDLLPGELTRRFLADAVAGDVTSLPERRVGGVTTAGLRLADPGGRSTIARVDTWADPATGVPLLVEVWARGESRASFTSEAVSYDPGPLPAGVVSFEPTPETDVERTEVLDIADAADQYAPLRPPSAVAGLEASESSRGAVGIYGSGLTQLVAIPLRDDEADPLREQVGVTPGSVVLAGGPGAGPGGGYGVQQGPLSIAVGGAEGQGGWLVAGTVTPQVLSEALGDLLTGTRYLEGLDR